MRSLEIAVRVVALVSGAIGWIHVILIAAGHQPSSGVVAMMAAMALGFAGVIRSRIDGPQDQEASR